MPLEKGLCCLWKRALCALGKRHFLAPMACKRLRGWELEMESGRVQQPEVGKALEKAKRCSTIFFSKQAAVPLGQRISQCRLGQGAS